MGCCGVLGHSSHKNDGNTNDGSERIGAELEQLDDSRNFHPLQTRESLRR